LTSNETLERVPEEKLAHARKRLASAAIIEPSG
ncbi:hypothetical protein EVAR_71523_1, partial [Eumeta japonica]